MNVYLNFLPFLSSKFFYHFTKMQFLCKILLVSILLSVLAGGLISTDLTIFFSNTILLFFSISSALTIRFVWIEYYYRDLGLGYHE